MENTYQEFAEKLGRSNTNSKALQAWTVSCRWTALTRISHSENLTTKNRRKNRSKTKITEKQGLCRFITPITPKNSNTHCL